ncbi:MAG: response regulator [Elusimicrobiota bacterium]
MIERAKVLIIDDDFSVRRTLKSALLGTYEVLTAKDGEEGLATARARWPDLIVVDVMMPRVDGYGVCRELRSDPLLRDIPVLILSTLSSLPRVSIGLDNGADAYIGKPFDIKELRARVSQLICLGRQRIHAARRNTGGVML